MIITRKIEIFCCEDDKELRKQYYERLYEHINCAVKVANMTVSHLFMLDNTTPYLSDEDREKLTYLGCGGQKATKRNAPYVAASEQFKGKMSMNMIANLQNVICKEYADDRKKGMWNRSLRSYKSNMPIPFQPKEFRDLRFVEYTDGEGQARTGCFFSLMNIPFQMRFGRDRSNNRVIVERAIEGDYKMCTSSIQADGRKLFLLFCVDIPQQEVKLEEGKRMMAYLDVEVPIVCFVEGKRKKTEIGSKEEFLHRRLQIQEAVRRCQINNKYATGGQGRRRKCQAIERYHDKEKNYVGTKLHTYSRLLVDLAVKHRCSEIVLMKQTSREEKAKDEHAKGEPFVLRNWSYFGLKDKINYKAGRVGIKMTVEK